MFCTLKCLIVQWNGTEYVIIQYYGFFFRVWINSLCKLCGNSNYAVTVINPQNGFFTKRVQNRDLELSTGASGSKLRCASFLSWTCSGKNVNSVHILVLTCFIVENWLPIICLYYELVPDASSGRNKTGIQHRIERRNQWDRFQINESIWKAIQGIMLYPIGKTLA